jgi:hypothetical protein
VRKRFLGVRIRPRWLGKGELKAGQDQIRDPGLSLHPSSQQLLTEHLSTSVRAG